MSRHLEGRPSGRALGELNHLSSRRKRK